MFLESYFYKDNKDLIDRSIHSSLLSTYPTEDTLVDQSWYNLLDNIDIYIDEACEDLKVEMRSKFSDIKEFTKDDLYDLVERLNYIDRVFGKIRINYIDNAYRIRTREDLEEFIIKHMDGSYVDTPTV